MALNGFQSLKEGEGEDRGSTLQNTLIVDRSQDSKSYKIHQRINGNR